MKWMLLLLLLFLPFTIHAETETESTSLRLVRASAIVAIVADWSQTRWMSKNYDTGYTEGNKVLGSRPSTKRVDTYFSSLLVTQYLINKHGSKKVKWAANLYLLIGHTRAVRNNYEIGMKFDF